MCQQIINGLTLGSVYALIALGYTMVYGILELINFAHGEIMMMGAFITFFFISSWHLPLLPASLLSILFTAILGIVIEKVAYKPLRKSSRLAPLISAIGVSIALQNVAMLIWGTRMHAFSLPDFLKDRYISFEDVKITYIQVFILLVSMILMLVLHIFVKYTKLGCAIRCTAQDKIVASLMGINIDRIISTTFAIGSSLAAVAGILIGMYYGVIYPTMGYVAGIKAFTAAVLGGIGNIPGAMLGGVLLGVLESLGSAYISSGYKDAIAFAILIIILLIKPSGIMGGK
ncbi:MAG: branched-chain amino acid ABC transporter permease [Candidatus Hydrogenedentota bacterium]